MAFYSCYFYLYSIKKVSILDLCSRWSVASGSLGTLLCANVQVATFVMIAKGVLAYSLLFSEGSAIRDAYNGISNHMDAYNGKSNHMKVKTCSLQNRWFL